MKRAADASPERVPLIAEHDTWVSVDPVIGCPARCEYCYLVPLDLTATRSVVRHGPAETIEALRTWFQARGATTWAGADSLPLPIGIGNYTDMLMTAEGTDYLTSYAALHARAFPNNPICVVTKARLSRSTVNALDAAGQRIIVFLSQSFMSDGGWRLERGPVADGAATLENARLLSRSANLVAVHFWRPLARRTVRDLKTTVERLVRLQDAGTVASVAIGLKRGPGTPSSTTLDLGDFAADTGPDAGGEAISAEVEQLVLSAGRQIGYPVYRHTSCAVGLALKQPEGLGTSRAPIRALKCTPCACPTSQRRRCDGPRPSAAPPSDNLLADAANAASVSPSAVRWSAERALVVVDAVIGQEAQTRLVHLVGHPVEARRVELSRAWPGAILASPR